MNEITRELGESSSSSSSTSYDLVVECDLRLFQWSHTLAYIPRASHLTKDDAPYGSSPTAQALHTLGKRRVKECTSN